MTAYCHHCKSPTFEGHPKPEQCIDAMRQRYEAALAEKNVEIEQLRAEITRLRGILDRVSELVRRAVCYPKPDLSTTWFPAPHLPGYEVRTNPDGHAETRPEVK